MRVVPDFKLLTSYHLGSKENVSGSWKMLMVE